MLLLQSQAGVLALILDEPSLPNSEFYAFVGPFLFGRLIVEREHRLNCLLWSMSRPPESSALPSIRGGSKASSRLVMPATVTAASEFQEPLTERDKESSKHHHTPGPQIQPILGRRAFAAEPRHRPLLVSKHRQQDA